MAKYYFVGTLLPALTFDEQPEITFSELDLLLKDNLAQSDYTKTRFIRRYYDIVNLHAYWLGEELDPKGELNRAELEEALLSETRALPHYVYEFVNQYPKREDRLKNFPFLLARFFQSAKNLKDSFLHFYLNLERELRLVGTALRAKKLGKKLSMEFQFEDPEEELIAQLLAYADSPTNVLPEKFEDLKLIFEKYKSDPLLLQRALDEYRFNAIDNFVNLQDSFSIERILAYFTQFITINKWFELDQNKSQQIVDTIIKG